MSGLKSNLKDLGKAFKQFKASEGEEKRKREMISEFRFTFMKQGYSPGWPKGSQKKSTEKFTNMKNKDYTLHLIVLIFALAALCSFTCCTKDNVDAQPKCQSVTFLFKETGDTIIHWNKVCYPELARYKALPKYSVVSACDPRIVWLIIK